jgi:hypothetical protein
LFILLFNLFLLIDENILLYTDPGSHHVTSNIAIPC